jgi:hypothetical protein
MMSVGPPAAKGTTSRTGRDGKDWDQPGWAMSAAGAASEARIRLRREREIDRFMVSSQVLGVE